MATTIRLNSDETAWVTVYAGKGGRSYDFTCQIGETAMATKTFTESEFREMLKDGGELKILKKPSFNK